MKKVLKKRKITLGDLAGLAAVVPVARYGAALSSTPFIGGPTMVASTLICSIKVFATVKDSVDGTARDFGMNPTIYKWKRKR